MDVISEYQAVRDLLVDVCAVYLARCRAARAEGDPAAAARWRDADLDLRARVGDVNPFDEAAVAQQRVELRQLYAAVRRGDA